MKGEKQETKKEKEEDWDFDFSIYENDDDEELAVRDITEKKAPVRKIKSRYANYETEYKRYFYINSRITLYSEPVYRYSQHMPDLWKFYSILSELWANIRPMEGQFIIDQMGFLQRRCQKMLAYYQREGGLIPHKVHNNLIHFQLCLYDLRQSKNLSLEMDYNFGKQWSKAKKRIVQ